MRPGAFPICSPESRAIARLFAQRQESKRKLEWLVRKKEAFAFRILRPRSPEHNKPHRSEWFESMDGSGKLVCILWVPLGMSEAEATRLVFPSVTR
jgi:hypothetical protein